MFNSKILILLKTIVITKDWKKKHFKSLSSIYLFNVFIFFNTVFNLVLSSGLPQTQGNSGNFQVEENLR